MNSPESHSMWGTETTLLRAEQQKREFTKLKPGMTCSARIDWVHIITRAEQSVRLNQ